MLINISLLVLICQCNVIVLCSNYTQKNNELRLFICLTHRLYTFSMFIFILCLSKNATPGSLQKGVYSSYRQVVLSLQANCTDTTSKL